MLNKYHWDCFEKFFCQDIHVSYEKLLTCDVDSPGPHEVHLVPHEDEGAVREAGAGGEADSLQSVRGRQQATGVSDAALQAVSFIPSYLTPNLIARTLMTTDPSPEDDQSAVRLRVLCPWPRGVAVKEHQLSLDVLEHDADAGLLGFVLWDWN